MQDDILNLPVLVLLVNKTRYRKGLLHRMSSLLFSQTRSCLCNLVSDYMITCLFRLGAVMCMGVTAGAYILTLFAVCILLNGVNSLFSNIFYYLVH